MILTVTSYKGGVGKTTTAIHLAAYLSALAPTLLVDGDAIRAATKWAQRGIDSDKQSGFPEELRAHRQPWQGTLSLPFPVVTHAQMARHVRDYTHIVIDTEANPTDDDFRDLAQNCDLMVIPTTLDTVATDGLTYTLMQLGKINISNYRVLLTMVPVGAARWNKHKRSSPIMEFEHSCSSFDIPTFTDHIPRLAAFEKAAAAGITVKDVKDKRASRAWEAYESAGSEISYEIGYAYTMKKRANQ